MKQLKAKFKYLLSFLKSDWEFEDYPLEVWSNPNTELKDIKFRAGFTNWALFIAHGVSKKEAISNLKDNFKNYKKNNSVLPRPGATQPLSFASTDRIQHFDQIAIAFFDKIIGIDYYDCFVSDESRLFDVGLDKQDILVQIKKEYGIDVREDDFMIDIFERIAEKASA